MDCLQVKKVSDYKKSIDWGSFLRRLSRNYAKIIYSKFNRDPYGRNLERLIFTNGADIIKNKLN